MKLKENSLYLFIRLSDYKKNNYVEEHMQMLKKYNCVFMLKMGKKCKIDYIDEVMTSGGGLIIKETARNGNKFYFCKIERISESDKYIYPNYYNELFDEIKNIDLNTTYNYPSYLDKIGDLKNFDIKTIGNWFKITNMYELSNDVVDKFKTISTGKSLLECGLKYTQVSQMRIILKENIEIKEVE